MEKYIIQLPFIALCSRPSADLDLGGKGGMDKRQDGVLLSEKGVE